MVPKQLDISLFVNYDNPSLINLNSRFLKIIVPWQINSHGNLDNTYKWLKLKAQIIVGYSGMSF